MAGAHSDGIVEAHGQRFSGIEGSVRELSIRLGGVENKMAAMQPTLEALRDEVWNHDGTDGIKTIMIRNIAHQEAYREAREKAELDAAKKLAEEREAVRLAIEERDKRYEERDRKIMRRLTIVAIIISFFVLLVEARHELFTGQLKLPVFHASIHQIDTAHNNTEEAQSIHRY